MFPWVYAFPYLLILPLPFSFPLNLYMEMVISVIIKPVSKAVELNVWQQESHFQSGRYWLDGAQLMAPALEAT